MIRLTTSSRDIEIAADALARGLLVAFPTETVYGLGADAFSPVAVASIFEAKRRPEFDPLIVHIAEPSVIGTVARSVDRRAQALMDTLWPGPLTLILPKKPEIPDIVTSGLDTVAVRCPSFPAARAIIAASRTAIAAPSANPFGYLSPTTADHVALTLGDRIDYLVDGGMCPVGVESTVLDLTGEEAVVLRPGGMEISAIEAIIGKVSLFNRSVAVPSSPGQLESHYAPGTVLVLVPRNGLTDPRDALARTGLIQTPQSPGSGKPLRLGALAFDSESAISARACGLYSGVIDLSAACVKAPSPGTCEPDQDKGAPGIVPEVPVQSGMTEAGTSAARMDSVCRSEEVRKARFAAAGLFAALHSFDGQGYDAIVAERAPETGLGLAINDRLFKASRKG